MNDERCPPIPGRELQGRIDALEQRVHDLERLVLLAARASERALNAIPKQPARPRRAAAGALATARRRNGG